VLYLERAKQSWSALKKAADNAYRFATIRSVENFKQRLNEFNGGSGCHNTWGKNGAFSFPPGGDLGTAQVNPFRLPRQLSSHFFGRCQPSTLAGRRLVLPACPLRDVFQRLFHAIFPTQTQVPAG